MSNSENLPPYELRSRWLHALTHSFPGCIVFRAARDVFEVTCVQWKGVENKINQWTRWATIEEWWTWPEIAPLLKKWYYMHTMTVAHHYLIMRALHNLRGPFCYSPIAYRNKIIKGLVILYAYGNIIWDTYAHFVLEIEMVINRPAEYQPLRTKPVTRMKRRWSEGDRGHQNRKTLSNRWVLEKDLRVGLKTLEEKMLTDLLRVKEEYDSGKLFRDWHDWVGVMHDWHKEMHEEEGLEFKYPKSLWTLNQKHEWLPEYGICPTYDEEELFKKWFH